MMVSDNRITNGMESDTAQGAQTNTDISMQADIVDDLEGASTINSEMDMREAFSSIQAEAETSVSAAELRLLYRRGADFIELLDMPHFQERVGTQFDGIRRTAEEEFAKTARLLNRRGAEIGAKANYAEKWQGGEPAKHGTNL
jgi:hypothetical protein